MHFVRKHTPLFRSIGRENHELDIVLFHEVLDYIARFDRVLTSPGGSLLLSGRSGVGRRTALLLTAHMHQIDIVTPHISRNYGLKQFKNDLKNVSFDGFLNRHYYSTCLHVYYVIHVHLLTHVYVLDFQYNYVLSQPPRQL